MPIETITTNMDVETENANFRWRVRGAVRALVCTPLERLGFANLFSTRGGGVSPFPENALNLAGFNEDAAENIAENRRRLWGLLDSEAWRLATAWQVHGANVVRVKRLCENGDGDCYTNDSIQCDALSTNTPGILVSAKTADCVPVLLADERTGACAAVHAGWRGTLAEILPRVLDHMSNEYGTRATDIHAAIGPAAGGCCYEVGADVVSSFTERFAETFFTGTRAGHARVDLHRANESQLSAAGVLPERIYLAPFCTMHHNDLFFSYRLEKQIHGRTGRLLAVIGKR